MRKEMSKGELYQAAGVIICSLIKHVMISPFNDDEYCIALVTKYMNLSLFNLLKEAKNKIKSSINFNSEIYNSGIDFNSTVIDQKGSMAGGGQAGGFDGLIPLAVIGLIIIYVIIAVCGATRHAEQEARDRHNSYLEWERRAVEAEEQAAAHRRAVEAARKQWEAEEREEYRQRQLAKSEKDREARAAEQSSVPQRQLRHTPPPMPPQRVPVVLTPQQEKYFYGVDINKAPPSFIDPISHDLMRDPVMLADPPRSVYDRSTIEYWFDINRDIMPNDPLTGIQVTSKDLIPLPVVRNSIQEWVEQNTTASAEP